jgi:hypothetical protein
MLQQKCTYAQSAKLGNRKKGKKYVSDAPPGAGSITPVAKFLTRGQYARKVAEIRKSLSPPIEQMRLDDNFD